MVFESFNINDFNQLIGLMRLYKESIDESDLADSGIAHLREAVETDKISFFVAKNNDKIVAMCSVCLVFSTYACEPSGIFEDFFIVEAYRHKGVARALTQFVFDCMKNNDIPSVWVGCADVDVDMYKSLGFLTPLGNLLTWTADE